MFYVGNKFRINTPNKNPQTFLKYKTVGLVIDEALKGIRFLVEFTNIEKFE